MSLQCLRLYPNMILTPVSDYFRKRILWWFGESAIITKNKFETDRQSGVGKASDHLRSWVRRPWKLPFRKWIKIINFSLHQWTWVYWEGRRALLSALWEKRRALRLASLKILLEHSRRKSTQNRETEKHRKNIVKGLKAAFSGRTRVSNGSNK